MIPSWSKFTSFLSIVTGSEASHTADCLWGQTPESLSWQTAGGKGRCQSQSSSNWQTASTDILYLPPTVMHCGQDIFSTYARYPESPQSIQFKTKKYTTRNKAQEFATICQRKRNCDLAIWFSARYTWKWDTWYISPNVYAFLGEYGKALSWASIYPW